MERQDKYPYERGIVMFDTFSINVFFHRDWNKIFIIRYFTDDNRGLHEMFKILHHEHKTQTISKYLENKIRKGEYTPVNCHAKIYRDSKIYIYRSFYSKAIHIEINDSDHKLSLALMKRLSWIVRKINRLNKIL